MQIRVLAASSSLSRRLWYRHELDRCGFETETADNGIACVQKAAGFQPHLMILEPLLTWGGSDGVLAVREQDPQLKSLPVIVVDLRHDAAETYRIGAYELAGYWKWIPTVDELVNAIQLALGHRDTCHRDTGHRDTGHRAQLIAAE